MTARGYEQDAYLKALTERLRKLELAVARNRPASGISVADPGGFFGGPGGLTIEDVIALIGAGAAPDSFLRNTLGGLDIVQPLGTLGATETIDLANGNVFWGTLDQDCTIGTTGWTDLRGAMIRVELIQDGTGGWNPTFSGVTWIGSAATSAAAGEVTHVVLFSRDGGTTIYGSVVGAAGSGGGPSGPMAVAKAYNSATQTVVDNTITALTLNSSEFDPEGYRVGSTFVIPAGHGGVVFELTGGTWSDSIRSAGVSAPTADLIMFYRVNGATPRGADETRTSPFETSNPGQPVGYISAPTVMLELDDGDVVELFMYIDNSGGSMVFGHASAIDAQTWMGIKRLVGAEGPQGIPGVGTVTLTGDSGTATGIDDITFVGADVVDDGGGAATVTVTGGAGGVTPSEVFLTGNVTMTNANTVYDGPTLTPAAGDYLVRGRLAVLVNVGGGAYVEARLIAGSTVVDEAPGFAIQFGNLSLPVFGMVTLDGSTAIKISAIANGAGSTILATSNSGNGTTNKASHLILEKIA